MCLENTKQSYVLLKSLQEAGKAGLDLRELVLHMESTSEKTFDTPRYVSVPVSLIARLRELVESDGIVATNEGKLTITENGRKGLRLLNRAVHGSENKSEVI